MRALKEYSRYFLILVLAGGLFSQALAQEQKEPLVPVPADTRLAETQPIKLGKLQIEAKLYYSAQAPNALIAFYKSELAKRGYSTIIDKWEKEKKLLRFRLESSLVSIAIKPKDKETQVVVAQYDQPFGTPAPEKTKFLWEDLVNGLPTKDQPGEDLAVAPRPPESVRMLSAKLKGRMLVNYRSKLSPDQAAEFYKQRLPALGWRLARDIDMQQTAKKMTPSFRQGLGGLKFPFADTDFYQLTSGGSVLWYQGEWGKVRVGVMACAKNVAGSLVSIEYEEKIEKR